MKLYYFLAGLPRTGNTVVSSLLNQNSLIYSSPLSSLNEFLFQFEAIKFQTENAKRLTDTTPLDNYGKSIVDNYYKHIDKPIIIDREKGWARPNNFDLIRNYITPNPKIIFTVRPILDILTSFINIMPKQNSKFDLEMYESGWNYKNYLTRNDNVCDYLMRPFGQIDRLLTSFNTIQEYPENFCVIQYDDLINKPQETMNKIYDFLELPDYQHAFNNIEKLEVDNDVITGLPPNMHEVRPQLQKLSQDPKEVLSDYAINKYANIGWGL